MTLNEYLEDYAKPETRAIGKALIQKELLNIPNEKYGQLQPNTLQKMAAENEISASNSTAPQRQGDAP